MLARVKKLAGMIGDFNLRAQGNPEWIRDDNIRGAMDIAYEVREVAEC